MPLLLHVNGLLRGRGERRGARHRDREEVGRTGIGTAGKRRTHIVVHGGSPKKRDKLGTRSNEYRFEKTSIPRRRERRGLPCSSDGFRRRRETWPGKLTEPSPKETWPGPQIGARRGTASATPSSSRIGQTSQILMESNFCI
jgi:hypothetical protein